tara:strand:+ start:20622 stop:20852 length:231 start_codon:yes stop_codon:yes gene_type:complete
MPRTRGMKLAIKEAEKILREKGPMTADELKSTLISLPKLKNTCITTHRLAQHLKRKPFSVFDRLNNNTKIYAIAEE